MRLYDATLTGAASKDLGPLHLDFNLGVELYQIDVFPTAQLFTALATTYPATKQLSIAFEPHYFAAASTFASRDVGVMGAVEYAVRSWLVFDSAIDVTFLEPRAVMGLFGSVDRARPILGPLTSEPERRDEPAVVRREIGDDRDRVLGVRGNDEPQQDARARDREARDCDPGRRVANRLVGLRLFVVGLAAREVVAARRRLGAVGVDDRLPFRARDERHDARRREGAGTDHRQRFAHRAAGLGGFGTTSLGIGIA